MSVFVVVAAFNEEKTIGGVIDDLKSHGYTNIIVANDGSKDNTERIAKSKGVDVVSHVVNLGQGAALRTGINYAVSRGADVVVTFDGDGQHQAKDIGKLIAALDKADVALGSRFLGQKIDIPFSRRVFLKAGALIFFLMYGVSLTDSHNGLRAFSRKAAQQIQIAGNGMEHASEIIEQISLKKLKFVEVPVDIRYTDYSLGKGQSSLNAFKIFWKMVFNSFMR